MKNTSVVRGRLAKLRLSMQAKGVSTCVIPSSDAHQSEYTPEHWKTRTYFSGFSGSAGTLLITLQEAYLWTDSRYFLQAERELSGTGIILQKEGLKDTPTVEDCLKKLTPNSVVAVDGWVFSVKEMETLREKLQRNNLIVYSGFDPAENVWEDRPPLPNSPVFLFPEEFSGESAGEKIKKIKSEIAKDNCNAILLCALDEIAWTFNMRGNDVPCNPVVVSYALITSEESVIFIDEKKVSHEIREILQQDHIRVAGYDCLIPYLSVQKNLKIRIDAGKTNYAIYSSIQDLSKEKNKIEFILKEGPSPVGILKAVKNETEVSGFKDAMEKDGVALVRLLMWLEKSLSGGKNISEMSVEEKLIEFRKEQPLYVGKSFNAIVGYQEHGAIIHYNASENTNKLLQKEGLLLMDTGGQYFNGTTDITRTIALGEVSKEMKHDFTLVLKGHIALATAYFPQGTRGSQLDVLARKYLWQEGLTYMHGTGHGIGYFLNVHEGPQNIRLEENAVSIEPGMVTSNEPGIYRSGKYGIRIENLILAKQVKETEYGKFYGFETLSLCPIDLSLVEQEILSKEEKKWLNQYHQTVFERLSPRLSEEEKDWLKEKTKEI